MEYIDLYNGKVAGASTNTEYKEVVKESSCTGNYSLRNMPYHDRLLNTPVEAMHLLKNVAERIGCYGSPSNTIGKLLDVTDHLPMIFQCYWRAIGGYSSQFQ